MILLQTERQRGADLEIGAHGSTSPTISNTHRAICIVAMLGLLGPAFAIWGSVVDVPAAGIASGVLTLACLVGIVIAACAKDNRVLRRLDLLILVLAAGAMAVWAATLVYANPAYGTDESAFVQYGAQLLNHGHDPYKYNMMPSLTLFRVPIQYATYTMNGGIVHALTYPSFSVLVTVPFLWLTGGTQSVVVANTLALIVGIVAVWLVLPKAARSLAVVIGAGYSILFGFAVAGVNALILLPLLIVVAWRWTETGGGGHLGRRGIVQAICFGLALATQQLAWFVAPFLLVGLYLCRRTEIGRVRAVQVVERYLAIAALVFFLVNGPFIVAGPASWAKSVVAPLTQHAVPYGQGVIDLATFAGVGGGHLALYTEGAILALMGLMIIFVLRFQRLWRAAFVFPSIALMLPARSLAEYWMTMISVWLVAIVTAKPPVSEVESPHIHTNLVWLRKAPAWTLSAVFVPAVALLGIAILSPSPLNMRIISVKTNGQFKRVWEVTVRVDNRSNHSLRPHFATDSIGQMTSFWQQVAGPTTIRPHDKTTVVLDAPNTGSMPEITGHFQLEAVTASPETVSVTPGYQTQPFSAWISPSYLSTPMKLGQTLHLQVQLRSQYGSLIRRAGVHVELGQVIYGQNNLIPGEAVINKGTPGASPAQAVTDQGGVAHFSITERTAQHAPLYFQAWALSQAGYPFGYSEVVSEAWIK